MLPSDTSAEAAEVQRTGIRELPPLEGKKVSGTFFALPRSPARPDCCFQAQPFDGVDLPRAIAAFKAAGFVHSYTFGINTFADGPQGKAREAERIFFAGEPVKPADPPPAPELTAAQMLDGYRIVDLDRLMTMRLTAFRLKDRVHLLDMNDAGLIDAATLERVPPVLRPRLEDLLAYPEGGPSGISMGRRSCPCQSSGVGNRVEPRRRSEVSSE